MQYQHEFFERSVGRWPDRPAVDDHGAVVSYAGLEQRANRIARVLRKLGVGPNERVCVFTSKDAAGYAAILGVLKAGGAWVPLSTAFPAERLHVLVDTLQPKAIVADASTIASLESVELGVVPVVLLGDVKAAGHVIDENAIAQESDARPEVPDRSPEDLAYIIFTSGSTGTPKGVMVQHRSTAMFLNACAEFFAIAEGERFAHFSDFTFDPSIFDLFHCWQTGGTLVPVNRRTYRVSTGKFLLEQAVNVVFTVPSVIETLREGGHVGNPALKGIRHMLFTGEPVQPSLVQSWYEAYPDSTLYNMYGTTETAIVSHWCVLPRRFSPGEKVPVGKVLPGMRVYLMCGDRQAAPGEVGESVVYGGQLSAGYWANRFQTQAVFVPNPLDPNLPQKVYRTGDLLSVDGNGTYYFAGRHDAMVKVRGHRVELAEIESHLRLNENVADAVVVNVTGTRGAYDNQLVGFVRVSGTQSADLVAYLRGRLPSYMVPSRIVPMTQDFPRNANGKIDREACRRLAGSVMAGALLDG